MARRRKTMARRRKTPFIEVTLPADDPDAISLESRRKKVTEHIVKVLMDSVPTSTVFTIPTSTVFTIDSNTVSMRKIPTLMSNGEYRNAPITGGEYMLTGIRQGAKEKTLIFSLTPVDAKPFKHIEFQAEGNNSIFTIIPSIEELFVRALWAQLPEYEAPISGGVSPGELFSDMTYALRRLLHRYYAKAATAIKAAERKIENEIYNNNPEWGLF